MDTFLLADIHVILAKTEDSAQCYVHNLWTTTEQFDTLLLVGKKQIFSFSPLFLCLLVWDLMVNTLKGKGKGHPITG